MQKWILYLFALVLFVSAKAQPSKAQLEGAKFAIMKRTVEFLSEDTAFKNVQSHTCEDCKTVEDLKRFTLDNKLINADSRVIDPLAKTSIDTSALKWRQSLNDFKQQAISQITGAEKDYRKKLPGYSDYTDFLDATVADVSPNKSTASKRTTPDSAEADNTGILPHNGTTQTYSWSTLILTWLPYIVAAVLLIALIYILSEKSKLKKRKEYYKSKTKTLKDEVDRKTQTIAALTSQKEKLEKELTDSELDRKSLEDRLKSLELKKVQKITPQSAAPVATAPAIAEKMAPKPVVQPPKQPVATIKYARYADMGDGFSNAELLNKPDAETIFELIIAPNNNTGEYKITGNPDSQRYALSNAQYFLGKTCQYDSFPAGDNATIRTDKPGTIKLAGNKWTIVNPAKISFS